eukprot:m.41873 g.41873  ORF g.41873 m.41873 type:complete len:392 (-) comp10467_c0_seq2:982-2157(-)
MDRLIHSAWALLPAAYGVLWSANYLWNSLSLFDVSSLEAPVPTLNIFTSIALFFSVWTTVSLISFVLIKTYLFTPLFLVPAILVSKFLPKNLLQTHLEASDATSPIKLQSTNGVEIDAVEIINESSDHWVVFSNANGVPYEHNLQFLEDYSKNLGVNVLTFNYRGVGQSKGWPMMASDLTHDGEAAVRYLLHKKGVDEEYIVFHGHSLGGGVSSILSDMFKKSKLINDRSFRSLSRAAQVVMEQLNAFMSILLCITLGTSFYFTAKFSPLNSSVSLWMCLVASLLMGYLLGRTRFVINNAPDVMNFLGWEIDGVSMVDPERSMCIFHQHDGMLPISKSDAYTVLQQTHGEKLQTFELTAPEPNAHMYPLNTYASEWADLVEHLKAFITKDK